jgi:hypothetical protein
VRLARNNRFAALFAAFAAHGVEAQPAVYDREQAGALREQLLGLDGALVWVNPIDAGHSRAPLDALLREVGRAGVVVSTHPDVIMKLGTKDVLFDTREMGWGSDVHRLDTLEQLRSDLGRRLATGSAGSSSSGAGTAASAYGVWRHHAALMDLSTRTRCSRGTPSEAASKPRCRSTTSSP